MSLSGKSLYLVLEQAHCMGITSTSQGYHMPNMGITCHHMSITSHHMSIEYHTHTTWVSHAHHMGITCYHIGIICTPHGYHMHTTSSITCRRHGHHMHNTWVSHGITWVPYYMHTTWVSHAQHTGITCTPHEYHKQKTWASHAQHMGITWHHMGIVSHAPTYPFIFKLLHPGHVLVWKQSI